MVSCVSCELQAAVFETVESGQVGYCVAHWGERMSRQPPPAQVGSPVPTHEITETPDPKILGPLVAACRSFPESDEGEQETLPGAALEPSQGCAEALRVIQRIHEATLTAVLAVTNRSHE